MQDLCQPLMEAEQSRLLIATHRAGSGGQHTKENT